MDTLRTLRTCGGSKIKRLVALLLVAPALASANTELFVTTGSMTLTPVDDFSTFAAAGNGFSASGTFDWIDPVTNPIGPMSGNSPFPPGPYRLTFLDTLDETLSMVLTVNGVPWEAPVPPGGGGPPAGEGSASAGFTTSEIEITHPGTYSTSFLFSGTLLGLPVASINQGFNCSSMPCRGWDIFGGGMVTLDAVPDLSIPGSLDISQATFTFKAPEPATTSLLLIGFGFGGLAALGRRHRCRTTLLPAG